MHVRFVIQKEMKIARKDMITTNVTVDGIMKWRDSPCYTLRVHWMLLFGTDGWPVPVELLDPTLSGASRAEKR